MTYDKQTSIIFIEAYLYQNQKMKFSGISLKFGDLFRKINFLHAKSVRGPNWK